MSEQTTGGEILVRSLAWAGAEAVFTTRHGGRLLGPVLGRSGSGIGLTHVELPHGQDAGHAATGYAGATGRTGVCLASPGAGATEIVTPLLDAYMDSVPLVALTSGSRSDMCAMALSLTKHTMQVTDAKDLPATVLTAFHLASRGRPGPVLVDLDEAVLRSRGVSFVPPGEVDLPGFRPCVVPDREQLRRAAALLAESRRPVLYVGGGVIKAEATAELKTFAQLTGAPVVTTLMARGAFPDSHPQHFGMPGMHGAVAAVAALQKADLIVALGARFDDRVTGDPATFAPCAKVIHADIDPAEIGKNRRVDVGLVGDARRVIAGLVDAVRHDDREQHAADARADRHLWMQSLRRWRGSYPPGYRTSPGSLAPQRVIERLGRIVGPEAVYVTGVGQHQMWASQFIALEHPRSFLNSGGAGTMGYAVPAAAGAAIGRPGVPVWVIDGDGCFQMTGRSLLTCAAAGIPLKVALINNASLGMVRQLQALYYGERHFSTDTGSPEAPHYAALAESYGCVGLRCERDDELDATIRKAAEVDDRPVLVDFVVDQEEMVWPMVPPGASNDDIRVARDMAPAWDSTD
ncbi:biosynthetic-type acetolactate synthase large subunit [Streptomyces sp. 8N706]|uniref:biosynthetic-type acetolactate synthase large subunit n=1 Tax=Streptomyces sp. 8N706 TaxID=3457416 RepID=UPI003FD25061